MAKVGVIAIDLVASTGKLVKPFAQAQTTIKTFASGLTSTRAQVAGMVGAIAGLTGGIISLYSAISRVKSQFSAIDDIAKSADRLGLTTEGFIGIAHGANLAGVEAEQLDKALRHMIVKKDIAINVGGAEKLLHVTDTQSALEAVADTMAGMATDAERLQYAVDVFGKGGGEMVNLLRGGSDALRASAADAEKLGLTISRIDAAKVEAANDAVTRLGALFDGVARKIAIEISPFITAMVDGFVAAGTEGEGMGGKVRAGVDLVIDGIGLVLDGVDLLRDGWATLQIGAQMALSLTATGIGFLVKQIELASESIVSGFRYAFAQAQQFVSEAVGKMIALLSEVATWIESHLPERFRLGIGAAAQEFSKAFDSATNAARQQMETQSFKVDLTFGDTATNFADTFAKDTERAKKEWEAFTGRERMSEGLRRNVEKIRADAEAAAKEAVTTPATESPGAMAAKVNVGALERGSQDAFAAFRANRDTAKRAEELALLESKKHTKALETLVKKGVVLAGANI